MNIHQIHSILFSIAILSSEANAHVFSGTPNYCEVAGEDHSMRKWRSNEAGPNCGKVLMRDFITKEDKKEILKTHNVLRAKVARGEETRGYPGPQPPASNMLEMVWDLELELIAGRWVSQCIEMHDTNRNIGKVIGLDVSKLVGQNGHKVWGDLYYSNFTSMTASWYDEVDFTPNNTISSLDYFTSELGVFGHYTQFVWAESRAIGCSAISFQNSFEYAKSYYCNYGIAGNEVNGEVYKIGPPASDCPKEYPFNSNKYDGLCSDGNEYKVSFGGASQICFNRSIMIYFIIVMYTVQIMLTGTL